VGQGEDLVIKLINEITDPAALEASLLLADKGGPRTLRIAATPRALTAPISTTLGSPSQPTHAPAVSKPE
jgi:hypothetical protein